MPYTINALDNEFAVASGSNVNSSAGKSTFDYPPVSTNNLVITSQEGDTSPNVFSVGDTYDISWTGQGGQDISNVTVIRSDPVSYNGDDGHAVVFEGIDSSGETIHIVWSPGFDLETWYFDNFDQGASPGFYTTDMAPEDQYSYVCFVKGTKIQVPGGTIEVQNLKPGDLVITHENDAQPLVWVGQRAVSGRYAMAPVRFDTGVLHNRAPLLLSPQHRVLVTTPRAELMFGDAEVLIPAKAFVGRRGITYAPCDTVTYVHLLFAKHEIVLAEGALCESLLLGPMAINAITPPSDPATAEAGALMPDLLTMTDRHGMQAARPVLHMNEAQALLGHVPKPAPRAPVLVF